MGRGGVGNIVRSRSHSREPERARSASRDRISKIWQKVTHQPSQDIAEEPANAGDGQGRRE